MNRILYSLLFLTVLIFSVNGQTYVSTFDELRETLNTAQAGDEIIIRNGYYNYTGIDGENRILIANGNLSDTITVRAEVPGKVFFHGKITLRGKYLKLEGIVFDNFDSNTSVLMDSLSNSRFTNNYFYQCGSDAQGVLTLTNASHHNRIDHNTWEGSETRSLRIMVNDTSIPLSESSHNRIDHNYFLNTPNVGGNDMEAIQISNTKEYRSEKLYTLIESNVIENFKPQGEDEVISIKCSNNITRNNRIINSKGFVTLRQGSNNEISGNHIEKSKGIRVTGRGHKIFNNFIQHSNKSQSASIWLQAQDTSIDNQRDAVRDIFIANNTLFNNGKEKNINSATNALRIEGSNGTLEGPDSIVFANNVLWQKEFKVIEIGSNFNPDFLNFQKNIVFKNPNTIFDSLLVNGIEYFDFAPNVVDYEISSTDTLLRDNGVISLIDNIVTVDIAGQVRDSIFDIGADEYSLSTVNDYPPTSNDPNVGTTYSYDSVLQVELTAKDIWLEAEWGAMGDRYRLFEDFNASGDIKVAINASTKYLSAAPTEGTEFLRFDFSISETDTFQIWARVFVTASNGDSYWVRTDTTSWINWNGINQSNDWEWVRIHHNSQPTNYVDFPLDSGSHSLYFGYRENKIQIDKIYITRTGFEPASWDSNLTSLTEYPIVWKDKVGVKVTDRNVTKTNTTSWWNSGAASYNVIRSEEDGWMELEVLDSDLNVMFGLSNSNQDEGYQTIEYNMYLSDYEFVDNGVVIYHNGNELSRIEQQFEQGDIFRIEKIGNDIVFKKNGNEIYNGISCYPCGDLIADVSWYTPNTSFINTRSSAKPIFLPNVTARIRNENYWRESSLQDSTFIENQFENSYLLYPNPIEKGVLELTYDSKKEDLLQFDIINLSGQIKSYSTNVFVGENHISFDLRDLENGLYILRLPNNSEIKFIKKE